MSTLISSTFSIDDFLRDERKKDLLRFSTAGSVDDGKSTLIGRLLYDTQSVYEDHIRSIEGKGTTAPGQLDFALLTDGLRAEREQGITIDVAYRYFSTARRKFIIADTPGHEQYTRNMATGASTADAAIILIDASKGVTIQSRRHAYIASLLGVQHIIVAINKMDLAGYDEAVFRAIRNEFAAVLDSIAADTGFSPQRAFVPVSALMGDNVVHRASAMPWYTGPSLLTLLESLPPARSTRNAVFRFPVQRVLRPDHTFRGFAGQIVSGTVRPGDEIVVQPSGRSARVNRIVTWEGDLDEAFAPLSVTLVLDRELDISRGDLIAAANAPAHVAHRVQAALVWMNDHSLDVSRRYLLKHASHAVPAVVTSVDGRTDLGSLSRQPAATLAMNDIGLVSLNLLRPIAIDRYAENRATGAFILIDPETNATVAAGMIRATSDTAATEDSEASAWGRITAGEREARWGHRGAILSLTGPGHNIDAIEHSLFSAGAITCRIDANGSDFACNPDLLDAVTRIAVQSGLLALIVRAQESSHIAASIEGAEILFENENLLETIAAIHQLLYRAGVFISSEKAGL